MSMRFVVLAILLAGCSASQETSPLVVARPYNVTLPAGFDDTRTWPLILVLHGYGATGAAQDALFGMSAHADQHQTIIAVPDGTLDFLGKLFWNADDACCDFGNTHVDDVAYLTAVLDDAIERFHVDKRRVFVAGHSNGAFMAHRLACERADRIAAIASVAGEVDTHSAHCTPSEQLAVAQIHGDADPLISYDGGSLPNGVSYPSTPETYAFWKGRAGCSGDETEAPLDLVDPLPGTETDVERATGCSATGAVELWRIHGAEHIPFFNGTFTESVYGFFGAHPKPAR